MRVLAFGTYDVRRHPRVRVLIEGLREHGDEVREVVVPLGLDTGARVALLRRPWMLPLLALRLLRCWSRLAGSGRSVARSWRPDAVLVGYLGHFDVLLARRLFPGIPVVLDHLVFAADTAADRGETGRVKTWLLTRLDRAAIGAADLVVLDTAEHAALLPAPARARGVVAPVGADRSWFLGAGTSTGADTGTDAGTSTGAGTGTDAGSGPGDALRVVFFGLFTPLQGAPVIGRALAELADDPRIQVLMIGSGQDLTETRAAAAANPQVRWRSWAPIEDLPAIVAGHDVCLGIFGTTPKARRVVPNKVFQAAAAGCAVVTSDTGPQREALGDAAVFVPAGDASALAQALRRLADDRGDLARRRRETAGLAARDFTPQAVVAQLRTRLVPLTATKGPAGPVADPAPVPGPASPGPRSTATPLAPRARLRYAVVSRLVDELAPRTILEIGAGQGGFAARLAARADYVGLEPDERSAAVAAGRVAPRGGTVIHGDDSAVPAGNRYDLVCAFEVLEHLEDDAGALARWTAFVRPGGHLLLSVPAWPARFGPMDELAGHYRRYHPDTISLLLLDAGLEAPSVLLYGWPLGYALEAVRNRIDGRKLARPHQEPSSMSERTASSGRTFQPKGALAGAAIGIATAPFARAQRLAPGRGTGLIALARHPADPGGQPR